MPRKSSIPKRGWNKQAKPEANQVADALARGPARGRGAGINPGNRFETVRLSILGEFRDHERAERIAEIGGDPDALTAAHDDLPQHKVQTLVLDDATRSIINPVDSPDLGFRWTINPYRGCEHGCVYCYARPTHENLGMSCGLDFETKIMAKKDAPAMLARELDAPRWKGETIMMSGVTDCYQPLERDLRITRGCLEAMAERFQPVCIVTKNRMVTRDIDLLARLASKRAAVVAISLTSLDKELARKMEPRASAPEDRLRAMRELSAAGVPVSVMTAPIIPGLNDHEIPRLLEAAAGAGATGAGWTMLRLPWQLKDVFFEWVRREYPERAGRVESFVREARGGELYDSRFGARMRGEGERAAQIKQTFDVFKARTGLNAARYGLSSEAFRKRGPQRGLFDAPD